MRLGSGLSNAIKSPVMSCFDVDLYAAEDLSNVNDTEDDLFTLFGFPDNHDQGFSKMNVL